MDANTHKVQNWWMMRKRVTWTASEEKKKPRFSTTKLLEQRDTFDFRWKIYSFKTNLLIFCSVSVHFLFFPPPAFSHQQREPEPHRQALKGKGQRSTDRLQDPLPRWRMGKKAKKRRGRGKRRGCWTLDKSLREKKQATKLPTENITRCEAK